MKGLARDVEYIHGLVVHLRSVSYVRGSNWAWTWPPRRVFVWAMHLLALRLFVIRLAKVVRKLVERTGRMVS